MDGYKLVVIGSTGGGVFSQIAKHSFVKDMMLEAVSDRSCGFLSVAESFDIPTCLISAKDGYSFSDALLQRYASGPNVIFLSFYTRLFRGEFLAKNKGRVFNCHPSILPSFKGMSGFEDTLAYGSRFMGCTLHEVDEGMDTGSQIIQAAVPCDPSIPDAENRHKVFLTQYYSTVQFLRWISDARLTFLNGGSYALTGVKFTPSIFSPNLDSDFFELIGEENGLKS